MTFRTNCRTSEEKNIEWTSKHRLLCLPNWTPKPQNCWTDGSSLLINKNLIPNQLVNFSSPKKPKEWSPIRARKNQAWPTSTYELECFRWYHHQGRHHRHQDVLHPGAHFIKLHCGRKVFGIFCLALIVVYVFKTFNPKNCREQNAWIYIMASKSL
jgi:hypothetical protein